MTQDYLLIRAAKYLGVAPWDLEQRPLLWRTKALLYEAVDDEVAHEIAEREAPSTP